MKPMWCAKYQNIMIRPIQKQDIEFLRLWRNDKSISKYLNPLPEITKEMQEKWYNGYIDDSSIITYAIIECDKLNRIIGSVALYDFDMDSAHTGKIVIGDKEAKGYGLGFWGWALAIHIGFQKLGISKYKAEAHEENIASQKTIKKLGFQKVGRHAFDPFGFETDFVLDKYDFQKLHEFLPKVELFEFV